MTSSDLLIETLTKFGESEPIGTVLIWTDVNGDIQLASNATLSHVMGMCEYAKLATFGAMVPKL